MLTILWDMVEGEQRYQSNAQLHSIKYDKYKVVVYPL